MIVYNIKLSLFIRNRYVLALLYHSRLTKKASELIMRLLHISDLHYGFDVGETAIAQRENYMLSLKEQLISIAKSTKIDYIFFTGDFAWSAKQSEFQSAACFILDILNVFELTPNKVFLCPGNHDVDRTELEDKEFPISQDHADIFLRIEKIEKLSRAYSEYISFCEKLNVPQYQIGTKQSYLTGWLTCEDFNLICLNSSWYAKSSAPSIKDKMWIGRNFFEVIQANNSFDNSKPIITIVHHPKSSWAEEERISYGMNVNLFDKVCKVSGLILSGHTHAISSNPVYENGACMLGTGALYDSSKYQNSFYIYEIDSENQRRLRYSISDGKWTVDQFEPIDGHNLKHVFSPNRKVRPIIEKEQIRGEQYSEFDIKLSSISYKSLDSISKKAYTIERSNGLPVYINRFNRSIELLEPFIASDDGSVSYSEVLAECIHQIENDCSIVVEGMQGTGKSSLMSLLYIDMVNQYRSGLITFYPIFIDIHEYIKHDSFTATAELLQDIDLIKKTIADNAHIKWALFVDGIDRFKTNFKSFEDAIYNAFYDDKKNLILCFGFAEDIHETRARSDEDGFFQSFINESTYHIKLQSISLASIRLRKVLTILCELFGSDPIGNKNEQIEEWIKQYCNGFLDFRTLVMLFQLSINPSIGEKTTLSDRVLGYHLNLINGSMHDLLNLSSKAVQYLLSGRKIVLSGNTDKNKQELILYRNKLSRDFLFSFYWVSFMSSSITKSKRVEFSRISQWKVVFPRTVNRFINDLIKRKDINQYVQNMIDMFNDCSIEMKSNLAFLLSRSKCEKAVSFLKEKWLEINEKQKRNSLFEEDFCSYRTVSIGLISGGDKDVEAEFFYVLANSASLASKNLKQHCLYYYGKSDFINIGHDEPITSEMMKSAYQNLENDIQFSFTEKGRRRNETKYSLKIDILMYYNLILSCEDQLFRLLNHAAIKEICGKISTSDDIPVYLKSFVNCAEYNYEMRFQRYRSHFNTISLQ